MRFISFFRALTAIQRIVIILVALILISLGIVVGAAIRPASNYKVELATQRIPCDHRTVETDELPEGQAEITQTCQNGEVEIVYLVEYSGSEEVSRSEQARITLQEQREEIKRIGAKPAPEIQTNTTFNPSS